MCGQVPCVYLLSPPSAVIWNSVVVPAHGDVKGDVEVGLVAARVELDVPLGRHPQDVPLHYSVCNYEKVEQDVPLLLYYFLVFIHIRFLPHFVSFCFSFFSHCPDLLSSYFYLHLLRFLLLPLPINLIDRFSQVGFYS